MHNDTDMQDMQRHKAIWLPRNEVNIQKDHLKYSHIGIHTWEHDGTQIIPRKQQGRVVGPLQPRMHNASMPTNGLQKLTSTAQTPVVRLRPLLDSGIGPQEGRGVGLPQHGASNRSSCRSVLRSDHLHMHACSVLSALVIMQCAQCPGHHYLV
jgi:hypothetical protein